jgi:hypothetical protein
MPHVCVSPTLTEVHDPAGPAVGVVIVPVAPETPVWSNVVEPQHHSESSVRTAQTAYVPVDAERQVDAAPAWTGAYRVVVVPSPGWP